MFEFAFPRSGIRGFMIKRAIGAGVAAPLLTGAIAARSTATTTDNKAEATVAAVSDPDWGGATPGVEEIARLAESNAAKDAG